MPDPLQELWLWRASYGLYPTLVVVHKVAVSASFATTYHIIGSVDQVPKYTCVPVRFAPAARSPGKPISTADAGTRHNTKVNRNAKTKNSFFMLSSIQKNQTPQRNTRREVWLYPLLNLYSLNDNDVGDGVLDVPQTADRRPQTADRRPQTADRRQLY